MMASVSLHPLASRSGDQSSTIVSVDVSPDRTPTLSSSAPPQPAPCLDSIDDDSVFGSSPTTRALSPNPFADNAAAAAAATQSNGGLEWGLHHHDIERYSVLDDPSTTVPIRAMTAAQFDDLHRQYIELDVPHSVVFPFLHGVDGDNPAQCAFFHAPLTGMPTPHYRGLTIVRADMPDHRKRASSSASKLSMISRHRTRADSLVSSHFSTDSVSSDDDDDDDDDEGDFDDHSSGRGAESSQAPPSLITTSHSASSGSSTTSESRASSLFSMAGSDTTMSTQCDGSDAYKAAEAAANHARNVRRKRTSRSDCRSSRRLVVDPQPVHSMLVSSVLPNEIISPPLVANVANNSLDVARQCQIIEDERCLVKGATFIRPRQADGISLRNFKTQCAKYATISDIVVYCPAGVHDGMLNFANWIRQAQDACYAERMQRNLGGLRYNVFIVTDPFDIFERNHPHLIAVDGSGFSRHRVDFIEREREEMQRFTEASEIDENVFVGCTANVPYAMDEFEGSSLSLDSYLPHEVNPHAFSICIETAEHSELPSASRLTHASHYLDAFEATTLFELNSQEALQDLHDDEDIDGLRPSLGPAGWSPGQGRNSSSSGNGQRRDSSSSQQRSHVLCPAPANIVHLRALGSGSCFEDDDGEQEAIDNVVNLCSWIHKQAKPAKFNTLSQSSWRNARMASWPKHQQQFPRRVLLHCSDGYTDSSILALAYLMYARNMSLPEAYLDLQNRCNRCFFVYGRDVPFLQKLEKRIATEVQHVKLSIEKQRNSWSASDERVSSRRHGGSSRRETADEQLLFNNSSSAATEQSIWTRGLAAATGLVTGAQANGGKRSTDMARTSTPTPRRSTPTPQSPHREANGPQADLSWFYNPHFQGSFPSRILPFLFLGNLSHAMNPAMLHALGITHVVSVGESALVPPSTEEKLVEAATVATHHGRSGSSVSNRLMRHKRRSGQEHKTLWEEERAGRIAVLDLKNVSDDGIDSLRPHLNRAVEFIEQARLQGGKVLVHCRVGVSRSATVCIAYVMAHCDLSMIESFLLVRSRRMNVLTQPTLLFVWELRGFEAHLTKLKRHRQSLRSTAHGSGHGDEDVDDEMHDADDSFSLAALSLSSGDVSHDQGTLRHPSSARRSSPDISSVHASVDRNTLRNHELSHSDHHNNLITRQSIFSDEDLRVDIGAGAGSVYHTHVDDYHNKPFNSGSLTRLDYRSAKLTHGCFCKLLSELNARYMVA